MIDKTIRSLILLTATMALPQTGVLAGEPLPQRALAQIGDHRFYHGPGIRCIALSPDGRNVASAACYADSDSVRNEERNDYNRLIVFWDAVSGERLRELRVPQGSVACLAYSADGKRLAASFEISDDKSGLVLFDVETGKRLRRLRDFPARINRLQFSADSKYLCVSEWGGSLSAWNAATGKRLRLWKPPPATASRKGKAGKHAVQGVMSPDGRAIVWEMCGYALGGCASSWMDGLRVHDALTNKPLYQKKFPKPDSPSEHHEFVWSFAFTADGERLVADCEKFVVWETATGTELKTFKVPGMVRFALSPDGRRAAIEEKGADREQSRLRLWDMESGKPLRELHSSFENKRSAPSRELPVFSADGKTLLLATDSTLRLYDAKTGAERALPGHRAAITPRFSADGRTLFTSCAERRCRWNVAGNKPIGLSNAARKSWEMECLAQSADEQLFLDCPSEERIRVRETATGRVRHTLPEYARFAEFSPDATRLLLYYENSERYANFQLYDVKTGEKSGAINKVKQIGEPVFSVNSRLVAWMDQSYTIHLHEAATGECVRTLRSSRPLPKATKIDPYLSLLFSPDGEQLIATGYLVDRSESGSGEPIRLPLRVFHVCSGREIARFYANAEKTSMAAELSYLACAPDGRLLAVAEKYSGIVRLLEIASGKVRAEFAGHRHGVHAMAFAPDGQTLASGGEDNVVFLWDVTGAKTPAATKASDNDLSSWWNDLASEDGKRAGIAIAALLRKPEASAAFLQEKLRPAEALDEKRLAQLIADLDDAAFETRETASRELVRLGERAEDALRRALTNRPSLEMRRRIEDVLSKLEPGPLPPETLRALRAIEVLEHIGTPTARRCLEALANGAAEARPTRDAQAALHRLTNRR
jgi:WD40 repeat protein